MIRRIFYPQARVNLAIVPADGGIAEIIRLTAVPPRSVSVSLTDARSSNDFDVEFDEWRFPLDSRLVKACSVDIHLADVGEAGVELETLEPESRILVGQVDAIERKFSAGGATTVRLRGRCYSAFLLDENWQTRSVQLGRPLAEIVEEVVATVPAFANISVVSKFDGGSPIVPGSTPKERTFSSSAETSIFEALSELALRAGAVLTVVKDELWIQPPRLIDDTVATPVFVEGRNLKELTIERKLAGRDLPNVLVQAVNRRSMETVEAMFPDPPSATTRVGANSSTETIEAKKFVVDVPDATPEKLREIASRIHEFYAQQQLKVSFSTRDLRTWKLRSDEVLSGALDDPRAETIDVTRIGNGTGVRVFVDKGSRAILEKALTSTEKARELQRRGYEEQVARELARGWRVLDTPFFVQRATHALDSKGVYSLNCEAINFITV